MKRKNKLKISPISVFVLSFSIFNYVDAMPVVSAYNLSPEVINQIKENDAQSFLEWINNDINKEKISFIKDNFDESDYNSEKPTNKQLSTPLGTRFIGLRNFERYNWGGYYVQAMNGGTGIDSGDQDIFKIYLPVLDGNEIDFKNQEKTSFPMMDKLGKNVYMVDEDIYQKTLNSFNQYKKDLKTYKHGINKAIDEIDDLFLTTELKQQMKDRINNDTPDKLLTRWIQTTLDIKLLRYKQDKGIGNQDEILKEINRKNTVLKIIEKEAKEYDEKIGDILYEDSISAKRRGNYDILVKKVEANESNKQIEVEKLWAAGEEERKKKAEEAKAEADKLAKADAEERKRLLAELKQKEKKKKQAEIREALEGMDIGGGFANVNIVKGKNITVNKNQENGEIIIATEDTVTFNKVTTGNVIINSENNNKITGLAKGEVSEQSTDAINGSQLNEVKLSKADKDANNLSEDDIASWKEKLGVNNINISGNNGVAVDVKTDNLTIIKDASGKLKIKDNGVTNLQLAKPINDTLAKVATREVAQGNPNTVTGGKIFKAVEASKETVTSKDATLTIVETVNEETGAKNFDFSAKKLVDKINTKVDKADLKVLDEKVNANSQNIKTNKKLISDLINGLGDIKDKPQIETIVNNKKEITLNQKKIDNNAKQIQKNAVKIDHLNFDRLASTASALATAGLPSAFKAGQSGVVAAIGQYQKATALAAGYTRVSDSGRFVIKLTGTVNTIGEVGGTVGGGYFW